VFRDAGIALVIFANHLMRASLASMQKVARQLSLERSLASVEPEVAPLNEVFRLQNVAELEHAEERYLPSQSSAEAPAAAALSA
jgi:phosphoenolpyruvate phosphomutase